MAIAFRKKSLEKLSTPEQLDALIHITTPSGWLALLTVGFCLAVALAWGIYGRVPTKLTGYGLLLNPKGLIVVKASSTGELDALRVELGQAVEKGDVVAVISHPQESAAVAEAEDRLRELQDARSREQIDGAAARQRKQKELTQGKKELQLNISANQSKIARLNERIENQQELVELGLITRYELTKTQEEREKAENDIASERNRMVSQQDDYEQALRESQQKLMDLSQQIEQARDELAQQQARLKEDAVMVTPYDGVVIELGSEPGERVNAGEELVVLERVSSDDSRALLALQYYPAGSAKQIQTGMLTQIAPGSVDVSQYGYLLARVTRVGLFPATSAGLKERLQNDELVRQIEQLGVVLEVESELIKDPDSPSGFKWTSSQGPPFSLQAGATGGASVIVAEEAPLALVVPLMKKKLLGIGEQF